MDSVMSVVKESKYVLNADDFYMDNGMTVLTESFHTRRGICCGNGCRHCPFGGVKTVRSTTVPL